MRLRSPFLKPTNSNFTTLKRFFSSNKSDAITLTEYESIKLALEAEKQRKDLADPDGILKAEKRLLIGFTCKKCQHRTHRTMSHHAYHNGIVLIECPGCQTRHLIADNLGWFKDTPNAARKIEEMTEEVGEIRRSLEILNGEEEGNEKGSEFVELLK